jgi:hypothetical protein
VVCSGNGTIFILLSWPWGIVVTRAVGSGNIAIRLTGCGKSPSAGQRSLLSE